MLAKKVSGAPVLNAAGKLVGVLSETDVLWKQAGSPQDEWIIPPFMLPFMDQIVAWRDATAFRAEVSKVLARTVKEAMTASPTTVAPTASLQEAAQLMLRKKVRFRLLHARARLTHACFARSLRRRLTGCPWWTLAARWSACSRARMCSRRWPLAAARSLCDDTVSAVCLHDESHRCWRLSVSVLCMPRHSPNLRATMPSGGSTLTGAVPTERQSVESAVPPLSV